MKAIILERRGDYAAVLCEDGTFAKTRRGGEIGETIELETEIVAFPAKKKNKWVRSAVAAALVLTVTGSTLGYNTASAYVSLDVEDSAIELTVNHFSRVIAVNAVSEDAEELATALSGEVKHQTVETALTRTMERLRGDGYLDAASDTVIAGIASDSGRRAAALTQAMENTVGAGHALYVSESSRAEREQAMAQEVSVGRFGFERDHRGPIKADGDAAEEKNEASEQTEPAVPASGNGNRVEAGKLQPEQPAQAAPRQERSDNRPQPQQSGGQPEGATGQPSRELGQPAQSEEPRPQGGELPDPRPEQTGQEINSSAQQKEDSPQSGEIPKQQGEAPREGERSGLQQPQQEDGSFEQPQNDLPQGV